jgi:DNA-binding response OmpR family regulator
MNGTDKKILLVEDEPIAQSLFQNRLQREGFSISLAEDGQVALNALSKDKPDLVVLDLMLPKVNGPEVLKHIRSEERLKSTPVLIISNAYMSELSQKTMDSGADRGMLKTECTPGRLVETVRDMLGFRSPFAVSDSPVNDEKEAEVFAAAVEAAMADELTLKETREEFIQKAPGEVAKIRESCLAYVKVVGSSASEQPLNNLLKQVRFLATRAGLSGCVRIGLLASAFEALLYDVVFKPGKATASVAQTFAQAVDCLERLCQTNPGTAEVIPKAKILVVDDDPVCNLAMVGALKRAHFEPVSVDNPQKAIDLAQKGKYDVVFLDINMPVLTGFQVCERLRGMPEYRETPVIFITSFGDFQNRARSILSGGNDLIPKPISPVELVLKTTIRLLQPQGSSPEKTSAAAAAALRAAAATNGSAEATPVPLPGAANGTNGTHGSKENNGAPPVLKLDASEDRVELANGEQPKESAAPDEKNEILPPPLKLKEEAPKVEEPKVEAPKLQLAQTGLPKVETVEEVPVPAAPKPGNKLGLSKLSKVKEESKLAKVKDEQKPVEVKPEENPFEVEYGKKPEEVSAPKPVEVKDEQEPVVIEEPKPAEVKEEQKPVEVKLEEKPIEVKEEKKPEEASAPNPVEVKEEPKPVVNEEPKPVEASTEQKPAETEEAQKETISTPPVDKPASVSAQPKTEQKSVSKNNKSMETNKTTLDEAARGVAQIIFGDDNITDMKVRLTRIALERYAGGTKTTAEIAKGVAQIIFGDENTAEMNVRLTKIALERYNVAEVLGTSGDQKVVAIS